MQELTFYNLILRWQMNNNDTLKRLNAMLKDINGDNRQILRALQDQLDYLIEKIDIYEEVIEKETGRSQPILTVAQKKRLAHHGRKLNAYLLSTIESTFSPDTIHGWYRELIAKKSDSTGTGQRKRGRKPISAEIVEKILFFNERNPDWGYDRIAGTMQYLGYDVSASTIRKVLNDHGIIPDPERRKRGDWQQFIETQHVLGDAFAHTTDDNSSIPNRCMTGHMKETCFGTDPDDPIKNPKKLEDFLKALLEGMGKNPSDINKWNEIWKNRGANETFEDLLKKYKEKLRGKVPGKVPPPPTEPTGVSDIFPSIQECLNNAKPKE